MFKIIEIKKVVATLLVAILVVSTMGTPVNAASGYANKSMKNNYSYTEYNCSFWSQANIWDVWWGAKGTSTTRWLGKNPYNADSITHKDILSCSGIGSMSIDAGSSGAGASASVSSHTATYTYKVSNNWQINVNYNYKHTGMLQIWNLQMRTSSTVQFGSSFYSWGT